MKRIKQISIELIALMGLMIATNAAQAEDYSFKYKGLYYESIGQLAPSLPSFYVKVVPENATEPYYSEGNKPTGAVTIPENVTNALKNYTVTEIGDHAFYTCSNITSLTIPASIKTIGKWAFYLCSQMMSFTIPANVKTIEEGTFANCFALKSVTLPNGIQEIGKLAFNWCTALPAIDLPGSVSTIRNRAFENCTDLKTVSVHWDTPLSVPGDVFKGINTANVTLKVPKGTKAKYKKAAVWKDFKIDDGTPDVVPVTDVTLNHHKVTVNGDISSKQLTVTVLPAAATNKFVTWKSSNADVASVDANGLVTIHKKGQATVTATVNDGSGKSDACLFDVISTVANETIDGLRVHAADGTLHLALPKAETVHIYNIEGSLVKTLILPAGVHVLPLPSGVYVVRVGERVTKVMVK